MRKNIILAFLSVLMIDVGYAQTGGKGVFRFLDLPNSAKVAALGSAFPLANELEFTETFKNPSLICKDQSGTIALNYSNYISDINFGSLQYGLKIKDEALSLGLMYINYGNFEEADANGNLTGNTFGAADYLLNVGYGKNYRHKLFYGANAKLIYGNYESYSSVALATDIAISYVDTSKNISTGLIFKNLGYQINAFDQIRENLPFEVSIALAKKLKYAPFRFHLTYDNLQKFDLTYQYSQNNQEIDLITGEPITNSYNLVDKLSRHLTLGTEILLSSAFNLQAAYNFQRSKELGITGTGGLAGLSFGLSLKLKKFSFAYAHSSLNAAGGNNYFSLLLLPNIFKNKN
ncbi:type IX secretion system protein PorQ [Pedobacter sp. SD-b]|uniref:Type IX secretion system protein PorQ n=1 Tax=Pedobacter segetis TaxID=2793069 RepID=A0ABS1BND4_9SPHI|nr:type IX secretion system protein PorQ [Pedobacter segetis]MBK0384405.1 type IX secretion system protein PorQ [Pedobacter segetis]